MNELAAADGSGGALGDRDYGNLLRSHLNGFAVQDPRGPHPGVMVWGTLEARVQTVGLTILAGLNDGIWPDLPAPDPWLNRELRAQAGLLLPDRRIGLAAHDFQMAIAAPHVVLTRARRDEEAETIPSRWLNRLTNLLNGMGSDGVAALQQMRDRGGAWLRLAGGLDRPAARVDPAPRPSPCPPIAMRPKQLAVTGITTLIRDPYAIYARYILRLRPLAALSPEPDAGVRGSALHRIMEAFIDARADWQDDPGAARARLSDIAREELARATPMPSMQALWHARLMQIADRVIDGEAARLAGGAPVLTERDGGWPLAGLDFRLTARPDRIDRLTDGTHAIYDYKSGAIPSLKEIRHFAKQLPLEAAILERGGFDGLGRGRVSAMGFISLGTSADQNVPVEDEGARLPDVTWEKLHALIAQYRRPDQGYTASRAAQSSRLSGDYDHLARFGEWDLTSEALRIPVGTEEEPR
jgi:RecB family exonuclease